MHAPSPRPIRHAIVALIVLAGLLAPLAATRAAPAGQGGGIHSSRLVAREIFDTGAFLQARQSGLLRNAEWVPTWGERVDMGRLIAHEAARRSVDARILLALVELWGGTVSGRDAQPLTDALPQAYRGATQFAGIEAVAAALGAAYGDRAGAERAGLEPGTYALAVVLGGGRPADGAQVAAFGQVYQALFGEDPATAAAGASLAAGPEPTWGLPWPTGERWAFTGGPHHDSGSPTSQPWSHLDFAPPNSVGCSTSNTNPAWIGAAAPGRVIYSDGNQVIVDHGGGWHTSYFHVRNDGSRVAVNTQVVGGSRLGHPSCQGGTATGVHVHFGIKADGAYVAANGKRLSGWEVVGTGHYAGYLRQGTTGAPYWLDAVHNNLTIGVGETRSGNLTAGQSLTYALSVGSSQTLRIVLDGSGGLDAFLELRDGGGALIASDDDSAGNLDSKIERAVGAGSYRLVVRSYRNATGGAYSLGVTAVSGASGSAGSIGFGESRSDSISPVGQVDSYYFNAVAGRAVRIALNRVDSSLDPYLELYDQNNNLVVADDDSGEGLNSLIQTTLPAAGRYRIAARSYRNATGGRYTLRLDEVTGTNLAQGRPAYSSSIEATWSPPARAFDGDMNTRWSSRFSDPQWIYVDLGANRAIKQVTLYWESAYGRSYGIYVQRAEQSGTSNWSNVFWTNSGRGGRETIVLGDGVVGRYVMLYGVGRGTPWGYSLYEMRVFSQVAPLAVQAIGSAEPEGGKELDDAPAVPAPLPPIDDAKVADGGEEPSAEGAGALELVPLAEEGPAETPAVGTAGYLAPTAQIFAPARTRFFAGADLIYIAATGADQDEVGDPAVSYIWSSSLDGEINTQGADELAPAGAPAASLAIPASRLSVGVHTLTLHVVDNEGVASGPAMVLIEVTDRAQVFLPTVVR